MNWTIADLPTLLHATDKAANKLWDFMYKKISRQERFQRTGDYIRDVQLENEKKRLIEEEILNEIIYVFKIDKATVSHYMKLAQVTRYFHGNTWFINYDELEKVILRHLKAVKKRKKRKYN